MRTTALIMAAVMLVSSMVSMCSATPSQEFPTKNGEVYDDWDVCRTRGWGSDGYFEIYYEIEFRSPTIVLESLGEYADLAYRLGEQLAQEYPYRRQLADEIFKYARDRVQYTLDIDQFGLEEFAQNADELAKEIEEKYLAKGDSEDYAILLAAMYKGAGFRSAIVKIPGHTATLVYLPDHPMAYWELKSEAGWVWAEATGRNNLLGWAPDFEWAIVSEVPGEVPTPRPLETINWLLIVGIFVVILMAIGLAGVRVLALGR